MAHRALLSPVRLVASPTLTRPCYVARSFSTVIDAPIPAASQQTPPAVPSGRGSVFRDAVQATSPRTNWTKEQISEVYNTPLIELTYGAVSLFWCQSFAERSSMLARLRLQKPLHGLIRFFFMRCDCMFPLAAANRSAVDAPPSLPRPRRHPDVHPDEHQDGRLQRRLQLLRPVFSLQHRSEGLKDGQCRVGA